MESERHTIYLALGSNLGDKESNIAEAYRRIEKAIGPVTQRSSLHKTAPWGFNSGNEFVNSVICCITNLSPFDLLDSTQRIEREMGRTEKTEHGVYHDRIIDIDILLYDNLSIDTPRLKIPHPLMTQRPFVMEPLKELEPDGMVIKQKTLI